MILGAVLHFLDFETAKTVASSLARALVPGSYVIISVGHGDGRAGEDIAEVYNTRDGSRAYNHSRAQIAEFFEGLELVPPGLVDAATWRPGAGATARPDREAMMLAGVGRKV